MPSQTTAVPVDLFSPCSRVAQVAVWEGAGAGRDSHGLACSSGEVERDGGPAAETLLPQKRRKIWMRVQSLCLSDPIPGTESQERKPRRQLPILTTSSSQRVRFQASDISKLTEKYVAEVVRPEPYPAWCSRPFLYGETPIIAICVYPLRVTAYLHKCEA